MPGLSWRAVLSGAKNGETVTLPVPSATTTVSVAGNAVPEVARILRVVAPPVWTSTDATPEASVTAVIGTSVAPWLSLPGSLAMLNMTFCPAIGTPPLVNTKRAVPVAPGLMLIMFGSATSTRSPPAVMPAPLPAQAQSASAHRATPVDKLWMLLGWIARARADKLGARSKLGKFMPEFTHLHLHTQYSLLDGAIRLDQLFPKVLERGMKSVAMTDHGNLFGALDFYQRAKAHGVKPIFGCETYVAPDRLDKTERRSNHLILLAKNEVGWKNLSYLNSMGYLEGFYYNPRIDKPLLREHAEGLIGLSACLGGEIAQTIRRRGPEAAEGAAKEFESIFGKGNFFLEMQPNGLEEQEQVNGHLIEISKKTGIGVVATNDCHYLDQGDARSHEILMCVQQKKTIHDEKRMHHRNDAFFVKTP